MTARWSVGSQRGKLNTRLVIEYVRGPQELSEFTALDLVGDVIPDYNYEPSKLVFTNGRRESLVVSFSPHLLSDLRVTDVHCTQRAFTATLEEARVLVSFEPSLWPNDGMKANLVVTTTSENAPSCVIPLEVADEGS